MDASGSRYMHVLGTWVLTLSGGVKGWRGGGGEAVKVGRESGKGVKGEGGERKGGGMKRWRKGK